MKIWLITIYHDWEGIQKIRTAKTKKEAQKFAEELEDGYGDVEIEHITVGVDIPSCSLE